VLLAGNGEGASRPGKASSSNDLWCERAKKDRSSGLRTYSEHDKTHALALHLNHNGAPTNQGTTGIRFGYLTGNMAKLPPRHDGGIERGRSVITIKIDEGFRVKDQRT